MCSVPPLLTFLLMVMSGWVHRRQLDTLIKAARALGKEIEIKIKRAHRKAV